jgi:hypothetical protein
MATAVDVVAFDMDGIIFGLGNGIEVHGLLYRRQLYIYLRCS